MHKPTIAILLIAAYVFGGCSDDQVTDDGGDRFVPDVVDQWDGRFVAQAPGVLVADCPVIVDIQGQTGEDWNGDLHITDPCAPADYWVSGTIGTVDSDFSVSVVIPELASQAEIACDPLSEPLELEGGVVGNIIMPGPTAISVSTTYDCGSEEHTMSLSMNR